MKLYHEISLQDLNAWEGAADTLNKVYNAGKIEELENILEDLYPDGMSETELNNLLWFKSETIFGWLGIVEESEEFKNYKNKFGSVEWDGEELAFQQEPYLHGLGSCEWYQAAAIDEQGNEYLVKWDILEDYDKESGDESGACDWVNPSEVEER